MADTKPNEDENRGAYRSDTQYRAWLGQKKRKKRKARPEPEA